jgi:hypothetical protein
MSILTYDTAAAARVAPSRKGFWARVFDRVIEARMRHAHEYLARHQHLIDDLRRHTGKA